MFPFEKTFSANQNVLLKAIAASGYYFTGWDSDGVIIDTADTITVSMTCPKRITAVFTSNTFQLKVDIKPVEGGLIVISPSQPGNIYPSGMSIAITATANEGYDFSKWSGDVSSEEASCQLIMNENKNVTAIFTRVGSHSASWWVRTIGIGLGIVIFIGLFVFLVIRIISVKQKMS